MLKWLHLAHNKLVSLITGRTWFTGFPSFITRTDTLRTILSELGNTLSTATICYWVRGRFSSITNVTSPSFKFADSGCHFCLVCKFC